MIADGAEYRLLVDILLSFSVDRPKLHTNVKRGRGRPKLTWDELVKRDLKDWNISKEIALDKSAWRLAINVPEP